MRPVFTSPAVAHTVLQTFPHLSALLDLGLEKMNFDQWTFSDLQCVQWCCSLGWRTEYSCQVTCMLPRDLIYERVAPHTGMKH